MISPTVSAGAPFAPSNSLSTYSTVSVSLTASSPSLASLSAISSETSIPEHHSYQLPWEDPSTQREWHLHVAHADRTLLHCDCRHALKCPSSYLIFEFVECQFYFQSAIVLADRRSVARRWRCCWSVHQWQCLDLYGRSIRTAEVWVRVHGTILMAMIDDPFEYQ